MLRIMLSAVGLHDPYGRGGRGDEGPILGAVEEIKPDILFLFPSRKQPNEKLNSTEENSAKVVEVLAAKYPKMKVYQRAIDLPDPTDYTNIIRELSREIDAVKDAYAKSQVDYYISVSSGTPQIQACFLILVNSNRIKANVYQTIAPRFVAEGEQRVRPVDIHFVEEENHIARARTFFRRVDYQASCHELVNLALTTVYPGRERKAEVFIDLVEGYHFWDLYQHERAMMKIKEASPHLRRFGLDELHQRVREQLQTLEQVIQLGEKEAYPNLLDLYHNALRRYRGGQYVDCLSRFKRLHEGVYYHLAMEELGVSITGVDRQPAWVKRIIRKDSGYISMGDIEELYESKKNRPIVSKNLAHQLRQFGLQRNRTINNHGMRSVSGADAKRAMELIGRLFTQVYKNMDISDYCFSLGYMEEVEELIFAGL